MQFTNLTLVLSSTLFLTSCLIKTEQFGESDSDFEFEIALSDRCACLLNENEEASIAFRKLRTRLFNEQMDEYVKNSPQWKTRWVLYAPEQCLKPNQYSNNARLKECRTIASMHPETGDLVL